MKGIIFDFNGTMIFDGELQERAWQIYLEDRIGRSITPQEFEDHIHGVNAKDLFDYFLNEPLSDDEIAELEEEKETIYRELCLKSPDFKLVEGLPEFLDHLKDEGIALTIATASNYNNVRFFFDHLGLGKWFDIDKVIYNNGKVPGKPDPTLFLLAAEALELDPQNTVIFEDSKSGVQAAQKAGAQKVIGITSSMSAKDLRSFGATETISDYTDILEVL